MDLSRQEKNGVIIAPYEDRFSKLENNNFFMATPSNQTGDSVFDNYSTYYNFTNIVSHEVRMGFGDCDSR
ncbi:hypothetical protein DSBG_2396 [Desulfosporosinus sp. BG]|nr:hypothetical protein DSBG_2396 [Desulfosporosinus sp. BG]